MSDFFKRATGRAEPTLSPDEQKVLESLRRYPDQTEAQLSSLFSGPRALEQARSIAGRLVLLGVVEMTQPYVNSARQYSAKGAS